MAHFICQCAGFYMTTAKSNPRGGALGQSMANTLSHHLPFNSLAIWEIQQTMDCCKTSQIPDSAKHL